MHEQKAQRICISLMVLHVEYEYVKQCKVDGTGRHVWPAPFFGYMKAVFHVTKNGMGMRLHVMYSVQSQIKNRILTTCFITSYIVS